MHRTALLSALASLLAGLLAASCALPPVSADPGAPALPARWRQADAAPAPDIARDWWRAFGSTELDGLIDRAEHASLDLAAAAARVRQAQANAEIAEAALLPRLTAQGEAGYQRRGGDRYGAALDARFEVDLWGGAQATRDGARSLAAAAAADRQTLLLTITAGVASAWLRAVALRERIGLAERTLDTARRLLALVEARERAGAATSLDLAQQRGLVANRQRALADLHQQATAAHAALNLLLARPGGEDIGTAALATLRQPALRPGLPSALLLRRPDIAQAEALLAAADANILAARAAMLPSLSLIATGGTGGDRLRRLFDSPVYSLVAGLAAPIFDAGRLAAEYDRTQARRTELLAAYRQTIIAAFTDVELALNAIAGLDTQTAAQTGELAEAGRAVALAETRYRAGAETLLALLDAQRTLQAAEDTAVQLTLQRLLATVSLYEALGGGWQARAE